MIDEIVRIIGSRPYGVSRLQSSRLPVWTSVIFQTGRAIIEAELNTMQQAVSQQSLLLWSESCGDGLLQPLDLAVPVFSSGETVATIHTGSYRITALINGSPIELRTAGDDKIAVQLPAVIVSEQLDLVYLEAWNEEIQPGQSPEQASSKVYDRGNINSDEVTNDLFIGAWNKETARRVQLRYAIKVAANASSVVGQRIGAFTYRQGLRDGEYIIGDGTQPAGAALGSVDGYRRAIPLAVIPRSASTLDRTQPRAYRLVKLLADAQAVDTISASSTPAASSLLALDAEAKIPLAAMPYTLNVDSVDGLHAYVAPPVPKVSDRALKLPPLNGAGKFGNEMLDMGHKQPKASPPGIDLDMVDNYHASAVPAPNVLPVAGAYGRLHHGMFPSGIHADRVDSYHASATPSPNIIPILNGSGQIPIIGLPTGHLGGMNADKVDNFHASPTPQPNTIPVMDALGKLKVEAFPTGHTNNSTGINADTLDGVNSGGFSGAVHSHGGAYVGRFTSASIVNQTVTINSPDQMLLQITPFVAGDVGPSKYIKFHVFVSISFRLSTVLAEYQALQLETTYNGTNYRQEEIPIKNFAEHRSMITTTWGTRPVTAVDTIQLLSRYNGTGNIGIQYQNLTIMMIVLIVRV